MKQLKRLLLGICLFLVCVSFVGMSSAWDFYGYTYDLDGNELNNTLVNITFWTMGAMGPSLAGSNSTTSDASGWFNLSVYENSSYMYKPVIRHTNATTSALDYIGQSLPEFPFAEFNDTTDINFYLGPAGTINITAINRTGSRIAFRYQVKDTKLGYPIASEFMSATREAIVYVPRDRNYSIMVYPDQAIPVSLDWNNFTSNSSYTIVTGLSAYNVTTHTIQKKFNCTDNLIRVSGYANYSGITGWDEFKVVPFLLEPGNMIYLGEDVGMPYNMSAWDNGKSDIYNLASMLYNITLPGPAESVTYLLFATARNGTGYYGGYGNITLSYSSSAAQFNFTMYPLMSTDWSSSNSNISLNDAVSWGKVNISSARQQFKLVNSSNTTLSNVNFHLEIKVDYTNYGAREFTFMTDISSGDASFYLPLLNATGIKEMNVYSQSFAPKRVGTKTPAQILANSNITMSEFNPRDIEGGLAESDIFIKFYISNSTCDLPNPDDSCKIGAFGPDENESRDSFSPLSAIIGGGKLNFRMGYGGIQVSYVNVDMLASGPPDASFDDSTTTRTSGNFESAMRFGSQGPTIYDYVLISMPYTEGSASVTGLNDSADVDMSIPILYDEDWNIIWNASANGTNGSALAGNQSHYSTYSSQWQTLMGQNNCTRNQSLFNSTNPCYLDTENNRTWIRLPHFSGTAPSVTGSVITAASEEEEDGGGGGGGGSIVSKWIKEIKLNGSELNLGQTLKELKKNYRITFNISGMGHSVGITNITSTAVTIEVASTPQTATLSVGEEKKFELTNDAYYDLFIKLNAINNSKADITIRSIHEEISASTTPTTNATTPTTTPTTSPTTGTGESSLLWLWILIVVVVIIVIVIVIYSAHKKTRYYKRGH